MTQSTTQQCVAPLATPRPYHSFCFSFVLVSATPCRYIHSVVLVTHKRNIRSCEWTVSWSNKEGTEWWYSCFISFVHDHVILCLYNKCFSFFIPFFMTQVSNLKRSCISIFVIAYIVHINRHSIKRRIHAKYYHYCTETMAWMKKST